MKIQNASVFNPDYGFTRQDIFIEDEYFSDNTNDGKVIDASGYTAIPGLIDLHLHGCAGYDFATADKEGLCKMAAYQAKNGITSICPTTMTLDENTLVKACKTISSYQKAGGSEIIGIYLEGPFVSLQKLGAQNPAYAQLPNLSLYKHLQEASGGLIKILAVAPELEGAMDLIETLQNEVICSVAHTAAGYGVATEAFRRGARQLTHIYNAMPPFSHRNPGVIGAALDTPYCYAEIICDGVHVHPSVVRATFQMFGDDRIIMISDSIMATGLGDGPYELGGQPVEVQGNTARLQGKDAIAGSATNLMSCLQAAVTQMSIPLHSAVKCASTNPAKALGVYSSYGSISVGKVANMVLLDDKLSVKQVFLRGQPLF